MKEEISEDEDGPAIAYDVERASDGAAHGVFSRHGMILRRIESCSYYYKQSHYF
jgi:hypothetical protein